MSVTLTADVSDTERDWHISEPLADGLVYLKADTEFVKVIYVSLDQLTIYVMRGVVDTTAAPHSSGVSLTAANAFSGGAGGIDVTDGTTTVTGATSLSLPAGTVTDAGAGVATVSLIVQKIGPFRITFETPGIFDAYGCVIADIPAGTTMVRAWAIVDPDEPWDVGNVDLTIWLSMTGDLSTNVIVAAYSDVGYAESFPDNFAITENQTLVSQFMVESVVACKLSAKISLTCTAGASDIYVLIATPAA